MTDFVKYTEDMDTTCPGGFADGFLREWPHSLRQILSAGILFVRFHIARLHSTVGQGGSSSAESCGY